MAKTLYITNKTKFSKYKVTPTWNIISHKKLVVANHEIMIET